jgi:cytochrome c
MPERFGFGAPAPAQLIAAWDIDVLPDGTGLPPGGGTAEQGRGVYQTHCAACHGAPAAGGPGMWQKFLGTKVPLTGKIGTITSTRPVRTVTSYWPYAPSLFDYIRRAMPMATPGALTDDEVYAVTAYLLAEDGLVEKKQRVDRQVLSGIQMPNRDGFVRQPLP